MNHFIELDQAADGSRYLVIHTGSRNLGLQVANLYQKLAIDLRSGKGELFDARERLITDYKAAGRRQEIQTALKRLETEFEAREPDAPEELCWLEGRHLDDYLHDMGVCQAFATRNRELIASEIAERANVELDLDRAFHTRHNYIDLDEMVLRKGAIAAHEGELVLIPLNMRDGSILARGKGNPAWNNSAPHGAGRLFSRAEARRRIALADFESAMAGIYTTSIDEATIDESPMAYKDASEILEAVRDTVDVIDVIKPIYNFKAAN